MIKIEITTTRSGPTWDAMLGAIWTELSCEHCRLTTKVQLRDIKLQRTFVCRGCKRNFRLIDHIGTYLATERSLARQLDAAMAGLTNWR